MSVYRRSVSNCVSFPCVVYFCLFSPLKDRYAFNICLQTPCFVPRLSKFLATHLVPQYFSMAPRMCYISIAVLTRDKNEYRYAMLWYTLV